MRKPDSLALTGLLVCSLIAGPAAAQRLEQASAARKDAKLKIFVLQGAGALNNLREPSATPTVVEVRDELNQPVRGAEVAFQLPQQGPGGFFIGQKLEWTGRTDANGQVAATPLLPNGKPGRFQIQVSATHGPKVGYAYVSQRNGVEPAGDAGILRKGRVPRWAKVALVAGAGAAAGGVVWGVRRGNGPSSVVLQPGQVILGGPR